MSEQQDEIARQQRWLAKRNDGAIAMFWRHFLNLIGCTKRCEACNERQRKGHGGFLVDTLLPGRSYFCDVCARDWGHVP